jgi:hypothetical protein
LKSGTFALLLLCGLTTTGCHRPLALEAPPSPLQPASTPAEAEEALEALRAREPATFKMLHQVAAKYQEQTFVMTGYVLGRKDGAFRVSAVAAMGPRLFDIAFRDGQWETQVHLAQLAQKLDPVHIGRSVQRIYFTDVKGTWERREGFWVTRAPISGDDEVDTLEVWRDSATMALDRKRYFKDGQWQTDIRYEQLEWSHGQWLARKVRLSDRRGFELQLQVTDYVPDAPLPEERLRLTAQTQTQSR